MIPKVSIICMTYNQENYIRQALDSLLMQETNFPFEIIVYDDASTDKTVDIIREYQTKYPNIIKPILQKENQLSRGVNLVPKFIWPNINGEYVAICDGDDYWTDPRKLQKQADFLDSHPKCSICFHRVSIFFQDGSRPDEIAPKKPGPLSLDGLIYTHNIPNVAVMYRWIKPSSLPERIMPIDWYIHMLHAQHGNAGFIPDVMARYRRQPNGIWFESTKNSYDNLHLKWGIYEMNFWQSVEKNIAPNKTEYHKFVCGRAMDILDAYVRNKKFDLAIQVIQMCPDMFKSPKPINIEARRWHHRFNKLLVCGGVIIATLILLIING